MNHKPDHVSTEAWDKARAIVSNNFTISIADKFGKVVELAEEIDEEFNREVE